MSSSFADKSGKGILLTSINRALKEGVAPFTFADIGFGAPEQGSFQGGKTTKVVFTALAGGKYAEGDTDEVFFDKNDLQGYFAQYGVETAQVNASAVFGTSTADVVAALNARYSTGFTADDIAIEPFEAGTDTVVLTATAGSYVWAGQLIVELVQQVPGQPPLADVVANPVLGDLNGQEPVPSYLVDVVLGTGDLNAKAQTADGKMLTGNNNPVGQFTLANNGEIEVALAARIYRSGELPVPVDGVYAFSIPQTGDWNFPFSVALVQSGAGLITDLYDVTLTLLAEASGKSVPFQLILGDDGTYHFVNTELALDISDSTVSEAKDVVQNIQRATFYKAQLGELTTNTGGAPVGDFTITLSAERRDGLVARVVSSIKASITVE